MKKDANEPMSEHEKKLCVTYLDSPHGKGFEDTEEWRMLFVHDKLFIESSFDIEDLMEAFKAYNVIG